MGSGAERSALGRCRWRAGTTATTTCRSTARSTTTCSAWRPSGTPGGATETQPISLDAIQELQLVVSPYDVRQGGFSGGGINAITKSGTNRLTRHRLLLRPRPEPGGRGADRSTKSGSSSDQQYGGSVGGPHRPEQGVLLRQRRLRAQRQRRSGFSVNGSGQQFGHERRGQPLHQHPAEPVRLRPRRTADEFIRTVNNDKVFVRTDFNLATQPSADGPPQLRQRAERHRPADHDGVLHARRVLPDEEQDQFDGRAVEQHVRHDGQRAALHLFAGPRPPRPARSRTSRFRSSR